MSRTQTNSEELAAQNVEYITCPFQKQLDKIIKISSALKIFHPIGQGKLLHCNCPSNYEEWRNISHLLLGQNRKVYPTFNHALKCVGLLGAERFSQTPHPQSHGWSGVWG